MCAINSLLECYGRTPRLTQRYKARREKPKERNKVQTTEVRLAYWLVVFSLSLSLSVLYPEFMVPYLKFNWSTRVCDRSYYKVCDMRHYSLLLHNFDPGYRNKIMRQNEERDAGGKYNTPCPTETPSSSLIESGFVCLFVFY